MSNLLSNNNSDNSKILSYLKVLSQYSNTVDLPQILVNDLKSIEDFKIVLLKVLDNCYILIKQHQNLQKHAFELQSECHSLTQTVTDLQKRNSLLEKEIEEVKNEMTNLREKLKIMVIQNDDEKKYSRELRKEMTQLKNSSKLQEKLLVHELNKKEVDNLKLNEKLRKNCGKYISVDSCIAERFKELEHKEELYKQTILTLQHHNDELLNEILDLKKELIFKDLKTTKL